MALHYYDRQLPNERREVNIFSSKKKLMEHKKESERGGYITYPMRTTYKHITINNPEGLHTW